MKRISATVSVTEILFQDCDQIKNRKAEQKNTSSLSCRN